jgi:hypothetical protein
VRDALVAAAARAATSWVWALPVVGETWDGWLNDIEGQHVRAEHLFAALDGAVGGAVEEGNVGGGTGMICHAFKGGIGTASRRGLAAPPELSHRHRARRGRAFCIGSRYRWRQPLFPFSRTPSRRSSANQGRHLRPIGALQGADHGVRPSRSASCATGIAV